MKKSNLFFICFLLAFSSACLKKDKGATSSGTTTTGSGQTGGGGGGGGGGSTHTVDSATKKFHYAIQTLTTRAGVVVTSAAFPSAGSPVIDSASAVTTLVSPAAPGDLSGIFGTPGTSGTNPSSTSVTNGLATTRSHDITLTADVSTCTTSMSLDCEVNAGDAKVLNLTNIDVSTFTSSTTQFSLTVDGSALNVTMGQNKVTRIQNHEPSSGQIQFEMRNVGKAAALGDYIYFTASATISGSTYSALYRVHKTTYDSSLVFNPFQSSSSGGRVVDVVAFNNAIYFTSSTSTSGDLHLLKYNPTGGAVTRVSSNSDLLNASLFTVHNNYLYFKANSSGGFSKLYKMGTNGNVKQLTDLCSGKSDVGHKMISTAIGLYVSLSDSTQCGDSNTYYAVSRVKNDDTIVPIARYNPGAVDTTYDGLGDVDVYNNQYYVSAGNGYYLYRDNNDGTTTVLVTSSGWGSQAYPIKSFAQQGDSFYWTANSYIWRYNFTTSKVEKLASSETLLSTEEEFFKVGDRVYFLTSTMSEGKRLYTVNPDNNNFYKAATIYSGGNDEFNNRYIYNNELYFYNKDSAGNNKFHKLTTDGQVIQLSNITNGDNEAPVGTFTIAGSSAGIIFSSTNFLNGAILIQ